LTPPPEPAIKPEVRTVAVRSAHVEPAVEEPAKTLGVNTALLASDSDAQADITATIEALRERAAENPGDLDAQWMLSLLLLATGRESEAIRLAEGVDEEAGDVIANTAQVVWRIRQALNEPGVATDRALTAVDKLRHYLSRDTELLIPKVALCTKVSTFGVYDEMDASMLVPHRPNRVIVYCEIKNFLSNRTPESMYRVTLSSRLEILTADGRSLWKHSEPDIVDISKQRREDFFLAQLVTFPPSLAVGDYVLKVGIEDTQAAKATEAAYPFRIGADALTAAASAYD
jgi:hypothetical protein